jgi:divalent metal cation (Fe/Co/Zn/Cd) transporter
MSRSSVNFGSGPVAVVRSRQREKLTDQSAP